MTNEDYVSDLKAILFQLELAASRVTDAEFKQHRCKALTESIQKCKKLIRAADLLNVYEQIQQFQDINQGYSDSLGLHNQI